MARVSQARAGSVGGLSCIVCALDEGPRIGAVLAVAVAHPLVAEVIVVDDGSVDDTAAVVAGFAGVRLISHGINLGKSRAIATGVAAARQPWLMFLDADLKGLCADDLTALARPVLAGRAGASLSLRANSLWAFRRLGIDFVSGERVVARSLLQPVLQEIRALPRFGIEVFMNQRLVAAGRPVAVVPWRGVTQTRKHEKRGLWRGLRAEWRMVRELMRVMPARALWRQMRDLRRLRSPPGCHRAVTALSRQDHDPGAGWNAMDRLPRHLAPLAEEPGPGDAAAAMRVRTVWISDVHLGTPGCRADALLDFLRQVDCDTLFLVGDIIDGWQLRRSWYWPRSHNDVIQKLLRKARKGTRVIFVPGNHDEFARRYVEHEFGGIEVAQEWMHRTADGRTLWITHGDLFDGVIQCARWLAVVGDSLYNFILKLNKTFNSLRARLGLPYWSLSRYLKQKVKRAVSYIGDFEMAVAREARRRGADGVVCGHIHHAEMRMIDGVLYCNDGDWVESLTALVEHPDGTLEILDWSTRAPRGRQAAQDVPGPAVALEPEAALLARLM